MMLLGSSRPNGLGTQLHPTAQTAKCWDTGARRQTVPRTDWGAPCHVSYSDSSGGEPNFKLTGRTTRHRLPSMPVRRVSMIGRGPRSDVGTDRIAPQSPGVVSRSQEILEQTASSPGQPHGQSASIALSPPAGRIRLRNVRTARRKHTAQSMRAALDTQLRLPATRRLVLASRTGMLPPCLGRCSSGIGRAG